MKIPNETYRREKLHFLLKKIRQERGIRQIDLAKALDVPQSFVSKYENGERHLDILELHFICQALGISIIEFSQLLEKNLNETE